jgi:hypothetical protein
MASGRALLVLCGVVAVVASCGGSNLAAILADARIAEGGATDGGSRADAGYDGPATDRPDCFPECIAALRRSCQLPPYGSGSCTSGMSRIGYDTVYCYPNGVRELHAKPSSDAGIPVDFTQADGQTICYRVVHELDAAAESYRTAAGAEVARVVYKAGDAYEVTCTGSTTAVTVYVDDPACRTLRADDCTPGECL